MIRVLTVIGTRPQIIKASALNRAIKEMFSDKMQEIILHTGQHYDDCMSKVFFSELGIPEPAYNLNVAVNDQLAQTAEMLKGIEKVILIEKPDAVIVYGDTNSTLAGAVVAAKMNIPLVHIEAGLRSFSKRMPEELNRIIADHASTYLFTPTRVGIENLRREGFRENNTVPCNSDKPIIELCGDVMYDNCLYFSEMAEKRLLESDKFNLKDKDFVLITIHRNTNTDNLMHLNEIFDALIQLSEEEKRVFIMPIHPRTRKALKSFGITEPKELKIIDPVSYFEMLWLEKHSSMIITDSGGVQKEAYFNKKKCLVLRDETEWTELLEHGSLVLAGNKKEKIISQYYTLKQKQITDFPALYGDGHAAEFICEKLISCL